MNAYNVSVHPIIKVDIKDKKIRVTYTVQCFEVEKAVGGGVMSALSNTRPSISTEKWPLETCYPFIEKDEHKAKKTSSKALVMTHAYSNVLIQTQYYSQKLRFNTFSIFESLYTTGPKTA